MVEQGVISGGPSLLRDVSERLTLLLIRHQIDHEARQIIYSPGTKCNCPMRGVITVCPYKGRC